MIIYLESLLEYPEFLKEIVEKIGIDFDYL